MKTMLLKRTLLVTALAFLSMPFFARDSFEIRGKVIKSDRSNGNYAAVVLLDARTMEIVAQQVCNENGEFVIEEVQKGEYILLVQKPGYTKPEKRLITIDEAGIIIKTNETDLQHASAKDKASTIG